MCESTFRVSGSERYSFMMAREAWMTWRDVLTLSGEEASSWRTWNEGETVAGVASEAGVGAIEGWRAW